MNKKIKWLLTCVFALHTTFCKEERYNVCIPTVINADCRLGILDIFRHNSQMSVVGSSVYLETGYCTDIGVYLGFDMYYGNTNDEFKNSSQYETGSLNYLFDTVYPNRFEALGYELALNYPGNPYMREPGLPRVFPKNFVDVENFTTQGNAATGVSAKDSDLDRITRNASYVGLKKPVGSGLIFKSRTLLFAIQKSFLTNVIEDKKIVRTHCDGTHINLGILFGHTNDSFEVKFKQRAVLYGSIAKPSSATVDTSKEAEIIKVKEKIEQVDTAKDSWIKSTVRELLLGLRGSSSFNYSSVSFIMTGYVATQVFGSIQYSGYDSTSPDINNPNVFLDDGSTTRKNIYVAHIANEINMPTRMRLTYYFDIKILKNVTENMFANIAFFVKVNDRELSKTPRTISREERIQAFGDILANNMFAGVAVGFMYIR